MLHPVCRAGEISSVYKVRKAVAQEIKANSEPAVRNGNVSVIVITGIILIIYMQIFWHKNKIIPNCCWQKDQLNHRQWVCHQKNNVQCVTLSAYKHFIHLFVWKISPAFHNNVKIKMKHKQKRFMNETKMTRVPSKYKRLQVTLCFYIAMGSEVPL